MSIIDGLITNRTGGFYNATDFNRVAVAIRYIETRLKNAGYHVPITAKQVWSMQDEPTPAQMAAYLADVAAIRAALAVRPTTPPTPPDMDGLTVEEANDIERILEDVDGLINNMVAVYFYSGEIYSGEG